MTDAIHLDEDQRLREMLREFLRLARLCQSRRYHGRDLLAYCRRRKHRLGCETHHLAWRLGQDAARSEVPEAYTPAILRDAFLRAAQEVRDYLESQ